MSENVVHLHKNAPPAPESANVTTLTVVPEPAPAAPVPLWARSGRAVKHLVTHETKV
ncbi:hypothetical protein AB0M86_48545 [Streptomyces sp. NPDC051639]|uniref:hypothetical protein n=1 Tax=unclassified Streptomyces TaxID=2593676 RepID=UPI002E378F09|nr:hypothetical protein [Streptomyces sp. NBC_01455]